MNKKPDGRGEMATPPVSVCHQVSTAHNHGLDSLDRFNVK
jgi:hypothetical protein